MNLNNYRTIVVTLTTRLPIAFGRLVGDAEWAMGIACGAHGGVGGFLPPRPGPDLRGDREAAAARPAAATGHVRQCGSGQDDGQRYPARQFILLFPENHRDHHHPPAWIPRHGGN